MTLSEKYGEIMERVTVTEEMRRRILQNLRGAGSAPRASAIRFPHWRRYAAAAACFAVLLIAALTVPTMLRAVPGGDETTASAPQIVTCQSADELARQIGFPVSDLTVLPFAPTETVYRSDFGEIAEIGYTGADGQTAVYRKSAGTDDNSGIYDTFADTEQLAAGSLRATVKGDGTQFTLAVWTDGSYAYSLALSRGVGLDEWRTILGSVS